MTTDNESLLDDALQLLNEGFCVLPCWKVDKHPRYDWDIYKTRIITEAEIRALFSKVNYDALAIVCGAVSGNLEVIDFDNKGELYQKWCERIKRLNPVLLDRGVVETTQNGGFHFAYRLMYICEGSKKLASGIRQIYKDGKETQGVKTLIETKSEGGLIVVAPSSGYKLIKGEYAKIEKLSIDERNMLIYHAQGFNEIEVQEKKEKSNKAIDYRMELKGIGKHVVAWDDFLENGNLKQLVERHGWKYLHTTKDGNDHYMRPDQPDDGKSGATWNGSVFYVWSTSTNFEANRGYNKSQVFSILECGGDRDKTETRLLNLGFGCNSEINFDPKEYINNNLSNNYYDDSHELTKEEKRLIIPNHLIEFEGLINDVMTHTMSSAPYPNKIISFVGALSLVSFVLSRKVKGFMGARPNLILLGLDQSAQGKDYPRKINSEILSKIGLSNNLFYSMASAEGLEDKLLHNKKILLQNDEFDHLLNSVNNDKDTRFKAIMDFILRVHTSSDAIFPMRAKAGQESSLKIYEPSLTIFGTAIPKFYYDALSEKMLNNGFFGRMLVFEGCGRQPINIFAGNPVPQNIIDDFIALSKIKVDDGDLGQIKPIQIESETKSQFLVLEFASAIDKKIEEFRLKSDNASLTIWGRALENVNKLALIKACQSNSSPSWIIKPDDVKWAIELVVFLLNEMTKNISKKDTHEKDPIMVLADRIKDRLFKEKNRSLSRKILQNKMGVSSLRFDAALKELLGMGLVVEEFKKLNSSQRESKIYKLIINE